MKVTIAKKIMTLMTIGLFCGSSFDTLVAAETIEANDSIEEKTCVIMQRNLYEMINYKREMIEEVHKKIQNLNDKIEEVKTDSQKEHTQLVNKISEINQRISELEVTKAVKEADMTTSTEKSVPTVLPVPATKDDITALKLEIAALQSEKKALEKRVSQLSDERTNNLKDMSEQVKRLKNDREQLVKEHEVYQKQMDSMQKEIDAIGKQSGDVQEETTEPTMDMDLPSDIKLNQWYPEKLVSYPIKASYQDGEKIDLKGLKMRFRRVIKKADTYKEEFANVSYQQLEKGYRGWHLTLLTPIAKYSEDMNGKMQITFKLVLKDAEQSMK